MEDPPGIYVMTDDAYIERMAAAIYMVSLRREVPLMRAWRTLSPFTKAMFMDAARLAVDHIDTVRTEEFAKEQGA